MQHLRPHLRPLAWLAALSLLCPQTAPAAVPAPSPASEQLAAFEADFTAGQARFDSGDYLDAVTLWIAAAARLPEVTAHRGHRLAVYQYVADAYARGLDGVDEVEPLSAAVAALDLYCEGFTRAYGTETPIDPKIAATRATLKLRLDAALAARGPQPERRDDRPQNPSPAPTRPARGGSEGMAIAGGALLGLGVGAGALAVLGAARGRGLEDRFDDPANRCPLVEPQGLCADLYSDGKRSNGLAIAGTVLAPLLLGGGVALLVIGLRRRDDARHALAPALAPGFVGLRLGGRF